MITKQSRDKNILTQNQRNIENLSLTFLKLKEAASREAKKGDAKNSTVQL